MFTKWVACMGLAIAGMAIPSWALAGGGGAGGGRGPMPAMVRIAPPNPRPMPPPGYAYQWVPPVYQAVTDRVWISERVETVTDWVQVGPGQWQQILRQVVTPGHYETSRRTVLVAQGYWQLVMVDPMPMPLPLPRPVVVVNPPAVGVEGYGPVQTEDLSKFSGLKEWPK